MRATRLHVASGLRVDNTLLGPDAAAAEHLARTRTLDYAAWHGATLVPLRTFTGGAT